MIKISNPLSQKYISQGIMVAVYSGEGEVTLPRKREGDTMELKELQKENQALIEENKVLQNLVKEADKKLEEVRAELSKFTAIGSAEDITESIQAGRDLIMSYKSFGEPTEIDRKMSELRKYESIGSVDEINQCVAFLSKYTDMCSNLESLRTILAEHQQYKEFGEISDLEKGAEILESYLDKGSLSEISDALSIAETVKRSGIKGVQEALAELKKYRSIATLEELDKTSEILEGYYGLVGSLKDAEAGIDKAYKVLDDYSKIGTVDQVQSAIKCLESYTEIGSIEDFQEARKMVDAKVADAKDRKVAELSAHYGINNESIKEVLELKNWDESAAKDFLDKMYNKPKKPLMQSIPESVQTVTQVQESAVAKPSVGSDLAAQFNRLVR
ncbi:hypothetical protein [Campylobacter jejuni]|uniref:Uncharacterized protein n=1 Tax=Campylobacter jejuni TaxID=197 RepID=A0A431EEI9_CAMJU|nr:hypothetical protein [Campylobacter jejuni]RTJ79602.1 hypothetical protein C3H57_04325 [Campylobacter jejuni]